MSRRAAEAGVERFVDETVTAVREEFSVERALRGTGLGAGGFLLDRLRENAPALERRVVEPEVADYRERSLEQLRILLDAVERGEPVDAVADELLAVDGYIDALGPTVTPDQRATVADDVLDRLERLGEGIAPIVERPEDEFWAAAEAALDRDAAGRLVEEGFPFTGPLRSHRGLFVFEVRLDPNEVVDGPFLPQLPTARIEYTDEAIRAMSRAERRIVADLRRELRTRFD